MPATTTYLDKEPIPHVGVSKVRTFTGPANLKIVMSGTQESVTVTDNFPSGLTEDDLLGALVTVVNPDDVSIKGFISYVTTDPSTGDIMFSLAYATFNYDVSEGRVKVAT